MAVTWMWTYLDSNDIMEAFRADITPPMPTLLHMPLPLVLAAVPKSTQKAQSLHGAFRFFSTGTQPNGLPTYCRTLPGTVVASDWLPLSLAILSSQLAVEVYCHQTGSSYFVLTLFFSNNSPSATNRTLYNHYCQEKLWV